LIYIKLPLICDIVIFDVIISQETENVKKRILLFFTKKLDIFKNIAYNDSIISI